MKNKSTIFITGVNGFVGSHLQTYLGERGYKLLTPTHKELDLLDSEAVDNFFKQHKIDIVIHTALVGGSRKEEHRENALDNNLRMFFNLSRNRKMFKKMIHCGSGAEYDKRFPIVQVKEQDFDKRVPVDEYGFSKYLCTKYIEQSENIICLRIFAVFGRGERYIYRFISNAICRNIFELPITMRQDVYFDYFNVKDFVRIVEHFIEHEARHKVYNIGSGKRINLKTIVKMINTITEKKSKLIIAKKGLNNEYTCNNERLVEEIPHFIFTSMEDSIKDLYEWYKKNKKSLKKELL
ncbi:MAG TPA: NAD-dependent epimerase/dehydratase family protein [Candidatus Sulfotelmatobacter sp.]|jgi:UDP-glucose 4-epimerase|nr:NAD-dependent epimerase/dehydratase family protein [Candidatus Sulfotelmatobacter sp.]